MADWGASITGPFHDISYYIPTQVIVNGTAMTFNNLESESSLQIRSVTRPNGKGGSRIVGYALELTLYIPNNRYADHQADLLLLQNTDIVDLDITLFPFSEVANFGGTIDAGLSGNAPAKPSTVLNLSCEGWTIETVERRPRMVLTFKALYSVRLMESGIFTPHFIYNT